MRIKILNVLILIVSITLLIYLSTITQSEVIHFFLYLTIYVVYVLLKPYNRM